MKYINIYSHILFGGVCGGIAYNIIYGNYMHKNIIDLKLKDFFNYGFLGGSTIGIFSGYFNKPFIDVIMEITE